MIPEKTIKPRWKAACKRLTLLTAAVTRGVIVIKVCPRACHHKKKNHCEAPARIGNPHTDKKVDLLMVIFGPLSERQRCAPLENQVSIRARSPTYSNKHRTWLAHSPPLATAVITPFDYTLWCVPGLQNSFLNPTWENVPPTNWNFSPFFSQTTIALE